MNRRSSARGSARVRVLAIVTVRTPSGTPSGSMRTRTGARLRLVRCGAVAAVVSDVPAPPKRPRRPVAKAGRSTPSHVDLLRYDRVMGELADRFPAMIPVRFGTVMSEDELIVTLTSRRPVLTRVLAHVRRRVQMTVRVVPPSQRGVSVASAGQQPRPATGRDYLVARARETSSRGIPGFEPVRDAVSRWVRGERVERRAGVASVYHLIPRSSIDAYREAVRVAAAAAGVRVIVSGPWPPYAFASGG